MSYTTLKAMIHSFKELGCSHVLTKSLAPNQDNEKNQIYFGYSLELLSLFPAQVSFRTPSESRLKRGSSAGKSIVEHALEFYWLEEGRAPAKAPNAKIIDYFQYPEMRFSGFLSGCVNPPDSLRRDSQDGYGRRILILGIASEKVYGTVLTDKTCNFVDELNNSVSPLTHGVFKQLSVFKSPENHVNPKLLIEELRAVGSVSQYESRILRKAGGATEPFRGNQGAGWTLEALLGIPRNSSGLPDKYGFELKAFLSTTITLMTPEPNFGYRHEKGLTAFLDKYGWPGTKDDDSRRFNGRHNTLGAYQKSGLMLKIENWDSISNSPTGNGSPNVLLVDPRSDEIAAGWSFEKLAEKWGKKHAGAMFVSARKYQKEPGPLPSHYSFGPQVHCGRGTSVLLLLKAISCGSVYLDPGDRVNAQGQEKKRTQWRVSKGRGISFASTLSPLYDAMETFEI
jgi:hypothetical protein